MRHQATLCASLLLLSFSIVAQTEEDPEARCSQQLTRFIGLQNYVSQEGSTSVPQFQVGLSKEQIEQLVQSEGHCAAWAQLQLALKGQHGTILDATEKKTGQPSPIR